MPPMMMAAIQPICCSSIWRGVGAEVELDVPLNTHVPKMNRRRPTHVDASRIILTLRTRPRSRA